MIVAANRDEFFSRPSAPPQILSEKPRILGGKDLLAGGTWLGVNEHGLLAGILNRRYDSEKKQGPLRSRGLLCLDILTARSAAEARARLEREKSSAYQPFNLLCADAQEAYVAYNLEDEMAWIQLEKGLHILTNTSVYDPRSKKMDHARDLFSRTREGLQQNRGRSSWVRALRATLSDHARPQGSHSPKDSICVHTESYGTVSSSIVFYAPAEKRFESYHTPEAPCRGDYGPCHSLGVP